MNPLSSCARAKKSWVIKVDRKTEKLVDLFPGDICRRRWPTQIARLCSASAYWLVVTRQWPACSLQFLALQQFKDAMIRGISFVWSWTPGIASTPSLHGAHRALMSHFQNEQLATTKERRIRKNAFCLINSLTYSCT